MISHWYKRLTYAVAALALGAGMLFISGCGDCCSDNKPVHSSTQPSLAQISGISK
jgi:hypothetical protein